MGFFVNMILDLQFSILPLGKFWVDHLSFRVQVIQHSSQIKFDIRGCTAHQPWLLTIHRPNKMSFTPSSTGCMARSWPLPSSPSSLSSFSLSSLYLTSEAAATKVIRSPLDGGVILWWCWRNGGLLLRRRRSHPEHCRIELGQQQYLLIASFC